MKKIYPVIFSVFVVFLFINIVNAESEITYYKIDFTLKTKNGYDEGSTNSNIYYINQYTKMDVFYENILNATIENSNNDNNMRSVQLNLDLNKNTYVFIYGYFGFEYLSNSTQILAFYSINIYFDDSENKYNITIRNICNSITNLYSFFISNTSLIITIDFLVYESNLYVKNSMHENSFVSKFNMLFKEKAYYYTQYPILIEQITQKETFGMSMITALRLLQAKTNLNTTSGFINTNIEIVENKELPEFENYWSYNSFSLESNSNSTINMTNFEINYPLLSVTAEEKQYYYSTSFIQMNAWGNWGIFDWLRRGLIYVFNTVIFLTQGLFYLLTIAFNYLIVGFFSYIISLIWNYVIFYVFYAICYIINIIYSFFIWAWDIVSAFFDSIISLLPITADGIINLFKMIGGFLILAFSYISTALLWVISFGAIDFDELFLKVFSLTENLYLTINTALMTFIEFLPALLIYIIFYINLLLMLYLKIIYCKFRGYTNRANELQTSLEGYLEIFRFARSVIEFVRNLIPIV
jgi:hypothetical protein